MQMGWVGIAVLVTVLSRLGAGIPNFSPMLAFALFAGSVIKNRYWALVLPIAILWGTDLYLGVHSTMFFTLLGVFFCTMLGGRLETQSHWKKLGLGAAGSSVVFFVVSNFGVWHLTSLYSHDWQGLLLCYEAGIPFFHNSFLSTLSFSYVFFYGYNLSLFHGSRRVPLFSAY